MRAQIQLKRASKQLEQDLKADLCDGWIIAALGQLVANESVCLHGLATSACISCGRDDREE